MATIARETRLDRLRFLVETQRLVNAGPAEADRVMGIVAQRAQTACRADGASVELAEGGVMVTQASTGLMARSGEDRMDLEGSLSGECTRLGMPLICRDAETDGRVDRSLHEELGLRSVIVAPLVHAGLGVGVLKVVALDADFFDDTDSDMLELMANLVTSSLSGGSASLQHDGHNPLQDPVTGVANRALLMDRLGQQVYEARRYARPFGLFVIDLDHFSAVNDTLGRQGGDAVLRTVAKGLNGTVRSGDTLARLEADQFVILCGNAERAVVEERLKSRIAGVMSAVNEELGLDGIALGASIGVVWSAGNDASAESLLTAATTALYRAKRQRYAAASA